MTESASRSLAASEPLSASGNDGEQQPSSDGERREKGEASASDPRICSFPKFGDRDAYREAKRGTPA